MLHRIKNTFPSLLKCPLRSWDYTRPFYESNVFCRREKVKLIKLCDNRVPENDLLASAVVCR